MPVEIGFKNNAKYPIKLCKPFPIEEESLFAIRLNEKHLVNIGDEKIKMKHKWPVAMRTKIDPYPESMVTINPGEEYKEKINIAEMVNELELTPGVYNAQLVYTMWVAILKEKPEYLKSKKGKTREWESNEIEIKIADKELQKYLRMQPKADLNKDGILTEEEKQQYQKLR